MKEKTITSMEKISKEEIKEMQTMLIKCKYYTTAYQPTGILDSKTIISLKRFQKFCSLPATGNYTPETKQKLIKVYNKEIEKDSFKVQVQVNKLNLREGPGMNFSPIEILQGRGKEYIVLEKKNNWGRLKNKNGWIDLNYTERV